MLVFVPWFQGDKATSIEYRSETDRKLLEHVGFMSQEPGCQAENIEEFLPQSYSVIEKKYAKNVHPNAETKCME